MTREPAAPSGGTPPPGEDWRPTASVAMLRRRAASLARTRAFFTERGVLEVDTPLMVNAAVTDVHIHSASVELERGRPLHLHTSPEYAMKRLLAAGSGDIFQIAHVVRGRERSRLHNPEFTLIEWYRLGFTLESLMSEVDALARALLGARAPERASEHLTYRDAFLRELNLDPLTADRAELERAASRCGYTPGQSPATPGQSPATPAQEALTPAERPATPGQEPPTSAQSPAIPTQDPASERDELLDLLMATVVGPKLGRGTLTFVHRYPASQAALAALCPDDPRVALRFELYGEGIELANGFQELASSTEQRARFERDQAERRRRGLGVPQVDERLLAALDAGLPPCSGVAVGFDRVLMLAAGAEHIDEVLAFPIERA